LLGIILWTFFSDLTLQGLGSIVGRGDLIRKIKIPRWLIVLSSSINALINLGLNLIVLAVFATLNQIDISASVLYFPFILLEIYLFALGISLFLAAAYVKYRDIGYIWEVALQAGFYLTPILYPLSMIKNELYQKLMLLNPMAQTIQDARYSVVSHHEKVVTTFSVFDGGWYIFIPIGLVVVSLVVGLAYFRSQSANFAENL
jgi:ABC-2 type transport system permease protein